MARKLRLEFPGACYHVLNRGNYRRDLFAGDGAAESFQCCLFEACERYRWRLHAFVVMLNHFHLALETPEANLSEGMKWLQGTWAARFNRYRSEIGRPFQGRYKALHVEPGHAFAQVAHYIHLNPVRAGITSAAQILEYRWSSLTWFISRRRPIFLVPNTVLAESGGLADTPAGWQSYLAYLEVLATEDTARKDEAFGRLSRGWAIGTTQFKAGLAKELQCAGGQSPLMTLVGLDRAGQREARMALWNEQLTAIAAVLELDLKALPRRKSADEKIQLAAAMKQLTSASNDWLAQRLEMGASTSVSPLLHRFRATGGIEKSRLKQRLSRLST